jgi:lysophospholipase L1-like esterase
MMFGSKLKVLHYEKAVQRYEERPVETGKILFYGDSLFTRCSYTYCGDNPEKGLPVLEEKLRMKDGSKAIINHGLGGSSADDLLYYYGRMVRPYKPRALFLATGANDRGFGYSPSEIMNILATMIDWFHAEFPGVPIYCFGRGRSFFDKDPNSQKNLHRKELRELLIDYCSEKKDVHLVDMYYAPFLYKTAEGIGDPTMYRDDIFDDDCVHYNALGYALLIDFLRDLLEKEKLL